MTMGIVKNLAFDETTKCCSCQKGAFDTVLRRLSFFTLVKPEGMIISQNSIVSPLTTSCLLLCCMTPQSSHLVASAYELTKSSMSASWLRMTFLLTVQESNTTDASPL